MLTNRARVVVDKKMTLAEKMYFPAIVQGLSITIKHFFSKPPTIRYPEVKREYAPAFRGQHTLARDEEGRERCTACGLCAVACPAEAITMEAAERKKGEENLYREEKYAAVYEINMLRCIFCGLCEEACPKAAVWLTRSGEHTAAEYDRSSFIQGKDRLIEKVGVNPVTQIQMLNSI